MNLNQYMYHVERLEKEKYSLECIIGKIDKTIEELEKPLVVKKRYNDIAQPDTSISTTQGGLMVASIIIFIVGFCIYSNEPDPISFWVCAIMLWLPSLLLFGGIILHKLLYNKTQKKEYDRVQQIIDSEYQQQLQNAKATESFQKQKANCYRKARNELYTTYKKTINLLKQMYGLGVIAEEYQYDLVAICTFSQYLRSRKCFTLEGHEGAYLLYEEEKFRGIVLGKLNDIISHLDRIEQNQYGIAMALKEINNNQNRILNNLQLISKRQNQQLENTECMRYSLEVLKTNSDIAMIYGMKYI